MASTRKCERKSTDASYVACQSGTDCNATLERAVREFKAAITEVGTVTVPTRVSIGRASLAPRGRRQSAVGLHGPFFRVMSERV